MRTSPAVTRASSVMARIALRAEQEHDLVQFARRLSDRNEIGHAGDLRWAMTHAAWQAARDARASAIICCTWAGGTVRALASLRPAARILALSPDPRTVPQLTLSWSAIPLRVPEYETSDELVAYALMTARAAGYVSSGDVVVVLAGAPHGAAGGTGTDLLRLATV